MGYFSPIPHTVFVLTDEEARFGPLSAATSPTLFAPTPAGSLYHLTKLPINCRAPLPFSKTHPKLAAEISRTYTITVPAGRSALPPFSQLRRVNHDMSKTSIHLGGSSCRHGLVRGNGWLRQIREERGPRQLRVVPNALIGPDSCFQFSPNVLYLATYRLQHPLQPTAQSQLPHWQPRCPHPGEGPGRCRGLDQ